MSSLTGRGWSSCWGEVLAGVGHLYLVQGASAGEKSVFLRLTGEALAGRGYRLDYCHRPENYLALEGLVAPEPGVVLLDRCCAERYGLTLPREGVRVVDLHRPGEEAPGDPGEALGLLQEVTRLWEAGFSHREEPGLPPDLLAGLLARPSRLRRFFAGTVAGGGPVDFVSYQTRDQGRRYFLKGAWGKGYPLMRQALLEASLRGWGIELYLSYLDPAYPAALVLPEAGLALVDGTSGCFPAPLPGDAVQDLGGGNPGLQAEWEGLLRAAGYALSRLQQVPVPTGVARGEVAALVSRLVGEHAASVS